MSEPKPEEITAEEWDQVTEAFITRLSDEMGRAGCNDVMRSEFPASICDRFQWDMHVLSAWARGIARKAQEPETPEER